MAGHIRFLLLSVCFLTFSNLLWSQTTTSCFEIEGILIDACGNDEGNNEMVRFLVGPNPLQTSQLQVEWATTNNPWGGVCQTSATAQKVAQLNNSIQACGFLKEPSGGILPANSKVLLISGFDFDPSYNSFAGLADTVYIIFNCASPGSGNFANAGSGTRTLKMSFTNPANCSDQVSYDRSKLTGGDGAAVSYTFNGTASYFNNGCSVPFTPLSAEWTSPGVVCAPVDLSSHVTGTPGGVFSGNGISGNTFDPAGLSGTIEITYTVGNSTCSVNEKRQVTIAESGSSEWTAPANICSAALPLNLNQLITGQQGGIWSGNGVSDSLFSPSGLSGAVEITYTIGSGQCQSQTKHSVEVLSSPVALNEINGRKEYCNEEISALSTNPDQGAEVRWYADSQLTTLLHTGSSFLPPGTETSTFYVVQVLNSCAGPATQVTVTFHPVPPKPEVNDTTWFCSGNTLPLLQASASGNISWYTDSTLTNLKGQGTTYQPLDTNTHVYYLTNSVGPCVSAPAKAYLLEAPVITASISPEGPVYLCNAEPAVLSSASPTANLWSIGDSTNSISVSTPGMYYLEVQGFCGITKDSILVIDGTTHAGFVASPDSGIAPLLVTISNQSQNAFVIEYKLNGIPVELNTENTLSLSKGGMNTITQIVTSESGCIDSVSTQVYVIEKLSIEIPNSFTPNADGFNDQFIIKNTGINLLECSIFNRWGAKITELKSPGATWDGLYNGKSAPDGVYFYVLKATAFNGEQLEKKGSITLIR